METYLLNKISSLLERYRNDEIMYDFLNTMLGFINVTFTILGVYIAWIVNRNKISKNILNLSRRKFLIGISFLSGFVIYKLVNTEIISNRIKRILFFFLPNNQLVVNKKTGVIHHREICKNHLPLEENLITRVSLKSKLKFHKSFKISILSRVSNEISVDDAIELLLVAIQSSPTSVHLYDKLIKLYGQLKRYDSIHLMLANVEQQLYMESKDLDKKTKDYIKYNKALIHIKKQRAKAFQRKKVSLINS